MFLGNSRIENAVRIINTIEDGKFPLLLNRIAQFLSNGNSSKPFTSIEETKLESSLELSKAEVETLIDGILEIFLVSAYSMLKPSLLGELLESSLHLNDKKAEIIVQVWATSAKGIVDNLKQKSFFSQLNHISYSVSVETASECASKEKCPRAQLQLSLSGAQSAEEVNLEFNHEELFELYKKLEKVQGQLDSLSELCSFLSNGILLLVLFSNVWKSDIPLLGIQRVKRNYHILATHIFVTFTQTEQLLCSVYLKYLLDFSYASHSAL